MSDTITGELDKLEEGEASSVSRRKIVEGLERRSIDPSLFGELSVDQLEDLLRAVININITGEFGKRKQAASNSHGGRGLSLSLLDKKILLALLSSDGKVSSLSLSRDTGAPLSTVQRRRKRLEASFLEVSYLPRIQSLGWHIAMIFISTQGGNAVRVGKELLSWKECVIRVSRAAGTETTDIVAEMVFSENNDLLDKIERVRSIAGVRNLFWVEAVVALGKNDRFFQSVIEKL